jgi:hypothetical protein
MTTVDAVPFFEASIVQTGLHDDPRVVTPVTVLMLQRTAGNQAVARLLRGQYGSQEVAMTGDVLERRPGALAPDVVATLASSPTRTGVVRRQAVQRDRREKIRTEADQRVAGSRLNTLKVTVAGSGDAVWKTHRNREQEMKKKGWQQVESPDGVKGGTRKRTKVPTEAEFRAGDVVVDRELSFSGPMGLHGAKDSGSNSIKKLIRYVPARVEAAVAVIRRESRFPIHILLRAHSRGAVAGSHIANALAGMGLRDYTGNLVKIEVVLFDPVPGPGHAKRFEKIELNPNIGQSTVVYSVKSGYSAFFDPAQILRARRIIITGEPHSAGIQHGFQYNGARYTGSDLTSLETGVYVEQADQPGVLLKVTSMETARQEMERTFESINRSGGTDERSRRIRKVLTKYFLHPQQ